MEEYQQRFTCDGCDKVSPWVAQGKTVEGWALPSWGSLATGVIRVEIKNKFGAWIILCDECAGPIVKAAERCNAREVAARAG